MLRSLSGESESDSGGAAADFGARVGKIVKLVRLIRLLRIIKAFRKSKEVKKMKLGTVAPLEASTKTVVEVVKKPHESDLPKRTRRMGKEGVEGMAWEMERRRLSSIIRGK